MDRLTRYRQIVQDVLKQYVNPKPANGDIQVDVIFDTQRDHYALVHTGWNRHDRMHGFPIHVDIIDEKIWIQHDGTNRPIAEELHEAGIPKEDIVLGFHPNYLRQHTGYGVG
jgi:hypothetical protein